MSKRNSPNDIREIDDLNRLAEIVVDKRNGKRAEAKKSRRNRHYDKQFIREALKNNLHADGAAPPADEPRGKPFAGGRRWGEPLVGLLYS